MKFQPILEFKEIKEDTNEKEKKRKLKDQQRWQAEFSTHIVSYFDENRFDFFHSEFNPSKDKLDCFVPAAGTFICGEQAKAGKKRRKKGKINLENETPNDETKSKKDEKQGLGCGRNWNSNRCMTKFVCSIEDKDVLLVQIREYGQQCNRCKNRYENPSFIDHDLSIMVEWMLTMILKGIICLFLHVFIT